MTNKELEKVYAFRKEIIKAKEVKVQIGSLTFTYQDTYANEIVEKIFNVKSKVSIYADGKLLVILN